MSKEDWWKPTEMPLPKTGKIKFTRTIVYDIDKLRDEALVDSDYGKDDKVLADQILDWLVDDMTVPPCSDTVVVTNGSGKELKWIF